MQSSSTKTSASETRLEIKRTFTASREKVFAAWVKREQLEKWMCGDVVSHVVHYRQLEAKPGGRYEMEVTDSAKGEFYLGSGVFKEVLPPEKLVFTWAWKKRTKEGSESELHPESQVTVEFFSRGPATEVVLTHDFLESKKSRDEHEGGWTGCFDALERLLSA